MRIMKKSSNSSHLLFDLYLLELIVALKGIRGKTSVVRILTGSYAKQTLQDVHLFNLEVYYGLYYLIDPVELSERIDHFILKEYLIENDKHLIVQQKGVVFLQQIRSLDMEGKIENSSKFILRRDRKEMFWKRMVLLVQTLPHLINKKKFIPAVIEIEVKEWIKRYMKPIQRERIRLMMVQLRKELNQIKEEIDTVEQQLLLYRLYGSHRSAYTWKQLESLLQIPEQELKIRFSSLIRSIFLVVCQSKLDYPVLASLFEFDVKETNLSKSTHYTLQLLQKGFTFAQVASKRDLTIGTIYDHVLEILIQSPKDLEFQKYISNWKIERVKGWIQKKRSFQLSAYKEWVNDEISFQDLRLILAYLRAMGSENEC